MFFFSLTLRLSGSRDQFRRYDKGFRNWVILIWALVHYVYREREKTEKYYLSKSILLWFIGCLDNLLTVFVKRIIWATYSSMWRLDLNLRIIMDRVPLPMSHCFVVVASLQKGTVLPPWPQGWDSICGRWFGSPSAAFGCCDIVLGSRILQSPEVNCRSKVFRIQNRTGSKKL